MDRNTARHALPHHLDQRPLAPIGKHTPGDCQHWRCLEAAGYQAACCGHYQPASAVRQAADSEPYCRPGRGCQA